MSVTRVQEHGASTEELLSHYEAGSLMAREEIVERFMPMARRLARRYRNSSEPSDDLQQVAYIGLLKTIDRYEVGAGSFTSFVITTIRGELKRHFRDRGWTLSVSRPVQERSLLVSAASDRFVARHNRAPTIRELAEETELPIELVVEALDASHGYAPLSLDAPVGADPGEAAGSLGDTLGMEDGGYESVELREAITPIVDGLPERERRILHMRFVEDRTQSDIAAECGLSQMHVSRLLRGILTRLMAEADPAALARAEAAS